MRIEEKAGDAFYSPSLSIQEDNGRGIISLHLYRHSQVPMLEKDINETLVSYITSNFNARKIPLTSDMITDIQSRYLQLAEKYNRFDIIDVMKQGKGKKSLVDKIVEEANK
jgi:hypothetical protein